MTGRRCDFCKDAPAPFGFAPPPSLRIPVPRPIWTCGDEACNAKAEERRQALIGKGAVRARAE